MRYRLRGWVIRVLALSKRTCSCILTCNRFGLSLNKANIREVQRYIALRYWYKAPLAQTWIPLDKSWLSLPERLWKSAMIIRIRASIFIRRHRINRVTHFKLLLLIYDLLNLDRFYNLLNKQIFIKFYNTIILTKI